MPKLRRSPGEPGDDFELHLLMEKLADIERRLAEMPQVPPSTGVSDKKLAVIASSIYQARRRRRKFFDDALFHEPAWDMLLDLFANRALGRQVSATSVCLASAVPPTTGLRYLDTLEEKGLIERYASPEDRRVTLIELTKLGYQQMRQYLVEGISRFDLPVPD